MADINLEDLQKEITAAERYMREAGGVHSSGGNRSSLEHSRRVDILQQFGRQPLSGRDRYGDVGASLEDEDDDGSVNSRYSTAEEREALITRLLKEHRARKGEAEHDASAPGGFAVGMGDTLRDPLVTSSDATGRGGKEGKERRSPSRPQTAPGALLGGDADYDETLFFASDLRNSAAPLGGDGGVATTRGRSRPKHRSSSASRSPGRRTAASRRSTSLEDERRPPWGGGDGHARTSTRSRKSSLSPSPRAGAPAPSLTHREQRVRDISRSRGGGAVGWRDDRISSSSSRSGGARKFLKSREDLEREVAAEFRTKHTFRPMLYTSKEVGGSPAEARVSGSERGDAARSRPSISQRIDELLIKREESLRARDNMKRDLEKSELLDCTFQPRITKKAQQISARRQQEQEQEQDEGGSDSNGGPTKTKSKTPRVNDSAGTATSAGAEAGATESATDVAERLYGQAQARQEQLRYQEARQEEEALYENRFHPNLNPRTHARFQRDVNHRPIHERVGDVQRAHREHMLRLRENYLNEERRSATFEPKIPDRSEELVNRSKHRQMAMSASASASAAGEAAGVSAGGDIAERLLREGQAHVARLHKLRQDHLEDESKHLRQATASKGSERLARANADIAAPFDERQRIFEARRREEGERLQQKQAKEEAKWFRPTLDRKSEQLARLVRPADENLDQQTDRLYHKDKVSRDDRLAQKRSEIYADDTFQPELDPVSRKLGRTSGLTELHLNRKGKSVRDKASRKIRETEEAECTFTPALYPYRSNSDRQALGPGHPGGDGLQHVGWAEDSAGGTILHRYAQDTAAAAKGTDEALRYYRQINMREPERMARDIKHYLKEKEERRQTELAAREVEELQKCTFQPHIPAPMTPIGVDAAAAPVVVRGIGRHMELRQLNEKLKADKAAREREVFRVPEVDSFRRLEDGSTIVKPFSLSSQSARPSRAVLELRAREDSELTFSPITNEQSKRDFVEALMQ